MIGRSTMILLLLLSGCGDSKRLDDLRPGDELVVLIRNSPTSYFIDEDRPTGFEYELIHAFAEQAQLRVKLEVVFTLNEMINGLQRGRAHIATAGIGLKVDTHPVLTSTGYLDQTPLIIYKTGEQRPYSVADLLGRDLVTLAGSHHSLLLQQLKATHPELQWREIEAADSLGLMQAVSEGEAELTIVDSLTFKMQQRLYPRLAKAFELSQSASIHWYIAADPRAAQWQASFNQFLSTQATSGELDLLKERHFGNVEYASRIGSLTFQQQVQSRLPQWRELIESVADEYQMDWRLLAAIAYQESHWEPDARSPTGVRGMMMITQATAKDLGISDRMDPEESLRGGARFFKNLLRRLPNDIAEPDRSWMALAAYNVGMGHLEDARVLTERAGKDPHLWQDVREHLPQLQNPRIYPITKHGFARGNETVTYVDNIRHYYSALRLQDLSEGRISPPVDVRDLLPDTWRALTPGSI